MTFSASFEFYPEVKMDDLSVGKISRPVVDLGEADVAKTLEVLQKQRRTFESTDRAAAEGDLLKFDYQGTGDGAAFEGGNGEDFAAVIGEGRLLKDFEQNLTGLKTGDSKGFDLTFPAEYAARELAGKAAHFEVQVKDVQGPVLPPVDAGFAKALGVEDGDGRPAGFMTMKRSANMFTGQAERRVRLGLILAEIVQANKLTAQPEQIRALIAEQAQRHEAPEQGV